MTADPLIAALELPTASRVDRRVPKTLLVEHGAPTAADRRHVSDSVDALHWVAALKPGTVGIPEYHDETRDYLEIAVLRLTRRDRPGSRGSADGRLPELVHRAVPYPVILLVEHLSGDSVSLSVAHKRWSQGEAGKTVLDGEVVAVSWNGESGDVSPAELQTLPLSRQPHGSMFAAYQGWVDVTTAFQAARVSGALTMPESPEQSADRQLALTELEQLGREIETIRAAARRETQVSRRVELNVRLKVIEARCHAARERLR